MTKIQRTICAAITAFGLNEAEAQVQATFIDE